MGELNKAVQPFRAEHVGSLLRPQELLKARTEKQGDWSIPVAGTLTVDELKPALSEENPL